MTPLPSVSLGILLLTPTLPVTNSLFSQAVVAHTFNSRAQEAEADRSLSSRPAWSAEWVPWQQGLDRENLSQNTHKKKREHIVYNNQVVCKQTITIEDIRNTSTFKKYSGVFQSYSSLFCSVFKAAYSPHKRQWQGIMSTAAAVPVTTTYRNLISRRITGPNKY